MSLLSKIHARVSRFREAMRQRKFMRLLRQHAVQTAGTAFAPGAAFPRISNQGRLYLGNNVTFNSPIHPVEVFVGPRATLTIGSGTFINQGTTLAAASSLEIGPDCLVGEFVAIHDTNFHAVSPAQPVKTRPVRIGRNVWIGHRAIILAGVTVGDHAVIGAGAVVTKDVPAKTIVAGNPAQPVRSFDCPDDWRRT
jgi:acetyltransferase-like isoleucine patch superfamily enzyme